MILPSVLPVLLTTHGLPAPLDHEEGEGSMATLATHWDVFANVTTFTDSRGPF